MASGTSSTETLSTRAEALHLLERGRAELSAEARWLRDRVDPRQALKRGIENHPAILVAGGLAIGLAATLLLRRKHHAPAHHHHAASRRESYAPPAPLPSLGGQLISQAAHMLLPLVVMPMFEKFVKQQLHRSQTSNRS